MTFRHCLACAAIGLTAFLSLPARGQVNNQQVSPVAQAAKQVQVNELALKKAEAAVQAARDKVKAQLMTKPQWAPVSKDLKKAQADKATAEKTALASARGKPQYLAFMQQRDEAEKVRLQAQAGSKPGSDDPKVSDAELAAAVDAYSKAELQMKAMEKQSLADDQAYNDATARIDAANAKLAQLDAEIDETLKTDTTYAQLQQQVATAQQQLESSKQQLQQARVSASQQHQSQSSQHTSSSSIHHH